MSEAALERTGRPASGWRSVAMTHVGNKRRVNEDAVLARADDGLWAVADGMGGHEAGDYASALIVDELSTLPLDGNLAARIDAVEDTLLSVNAALQSYAAGRGQDKTCGSTVAVLLAFDYLGVVLWAGDSRLYRLRGDRLEQITRDHNPIADLLETGAVSEAEALAADTNVITRAVGGYGPLHLDIAAFELQPQDRYLLCTDGLYRELSELNLKRSLVRDVTSAGQELLAQTLAGTAADNVSLIAIEHADRAGS